MLALAAAARAQSTVPTLTQALPAQTLGAGSAAVNIDLRSYFTVPGITGQVAQFDTVLGKFNVDLLASDAPLSVANFLSYVNGPESPEKKNYNNTIVHRSTPLGPNNTNRIVQGGGYTPPNGTSIGRNSPIALEYKLPNVRGTLAMARTSALNSATSEWFFNVDDNTTALGTGNGGGYAVFARVLGSGMSVVDAIAALPTFNVDGGVFATLPLRDVVTGQASIQLANFIVVTSVTVVPLYPTTNTAPAVLNFAVANNNSAVVTATLNGSSLAITPVGVGTATLSVRAGDANNNFASSTMAVTVTATASAPVITTQPVSQSVATGSSAVFNVVATGVPTPTYQWKFNNGDIADATGARLILPAGTAQAGTYSVVVTNSAGTLSSTNAALAFSNTTDVGRLINLSVNAALTAGEPSFTVGTVVGGGAAGVTKPLLIRAAGPSLTQLGVPGALADPTLQVFSSTNAVVATNDNWSTPIGSGAADGPTLSSVFSRLGAFSFVTASSKDSAIFNPALIPGGYTVTVNGVGGATGTVIAEIYDGTAGGTFSASTPRLLDVSVLKQIPSGGSVTAGFVIGGNTSRTVLIRAIGPGLAALGVPSASTLADPFVQLYDGASKKILENDNWGGEPKLVAVNASVGAFAVANPASRDAMLLVTLTPGNYSAVVSGVGAAAGLAIVEVYEIP